MYRSLAPSTTRSAANPSDFFVAPGHEALDVEEVVDRDVRWVVVRKIDVAAEIAMQLSRS